MAINLANPVNWQHPLNRGRVAWWRNLSGGGGTTAYDLCHRYDGTMGSGVSRVGRSSNPYISNALKFNGGSNASVNCGDFDVSKNNALTVALWVKRTSTSLWEDFVAKWLDASQQSFTLTVRGSPPTDAILFGVASSFGNVRRKVSSTTLSDTNWHRLLATYNGATNGINIYLDGIDTSASDSDLGAFSGTMGNASTSVRIGNVSTENPPTSTMEDVSIWTRAFSSDEAKLDYNLSRTGYPGVLNRIRSGFATSIAASSFQPAWARGSNVLIRSMA